MPFRSLVRVLLSVFAVVAFSTSATAKDHCAAAKSKVECGKKTSCAWTKSCVAKAGKTKASVAKPAAMKGNAAAAKPAGKKPAGKKPAVAAPMPVPTEDALPAEDADTESMGGEDDF